MTCVELAETSLFPFLPPFFAVAAGTTAFTMDLSKSQDGLFSKKAFGIFGLIGLEHQN